MTLTAPMAIDNWLPYKLVWREQWLCQWLPWDGASFSEPFFSETLQRCRSTQSPDQGRYASYTSLDVLAAFAGAQIDSVEPSGFIFHASRCGSTLLTQMLGVNPAHIVLSEVPLIDQILRLPLQTEKTAPTDIAELLVAAIRLLGRKRSGREEQLYIKLDSWHLAFAPLLRQLFPNVPFILLYRTPSEILQSHRARPGTQAVPGLLEAELFGMSQSEIGIDQSEYLDRVLAYYFSGFGQIAMQDERALLLDYRLGRVELMRRTAQHFQLPMSEEDIALMESRGRFHSKYPDRIFSEERVQDDLDPKSGRAQQAYLRLEEMRAATSQKSS